MTGSLSEILVPFYQITQHHIHRIDSTVETSNCIEIYDATVQMYKLIYKEIQTHKELCEGQK